MEHLKGALPRVPRLIGFSQGSESMRLPDDIEQFILVGQYARAVEALARRRGIASEEARERIKARLLLEMPVVEGSRSAKAQARRTGLLPRLKRLFGNRSVIGMAARWGK